ncbi:MAG: hypothetical protein LBO05_08315 [Deltaproteobacteria bacterium]|nr:hypothetical protein [Deltaproteobacteria bacterium]
MCDVWVRDLFKGATLVAFLASDLVFAFFPEFRRTDRLARRKAAVSRVPHRLGAKKDIENIIKMFDNDSPYPRSKDQKSERSELRIISY